MSPVVFMVVGVGAMIWFHGSAPWLVGWRRYLPYAVGAFFALTGVGSIVRILRRDAAREAAQRALEEHRDAPWRVRPEWRQNEIGTAATLDRSFVVFAVVWNLFSWPLAYFLIQAEQGGGDQAVWLVGFFPLMGLVMLAKLAVDVARIRKFGETVVALEPMPCRLGRRCSGRVRIRVRRDAIPEDGFRVMVSCYRQIVRYVRDSDGDRKRRIERDLLWRDETRLQGEPTVDGTGVEVPFAFHLPDDVPPSTPLKLDNRILWEVAADAELPGIDFSAAVEVPVFAAEPGLEAVEAGDQGLLPRDEMPEGRDVAAIASAGSNEMAKPVPSWAFDEPLTEGILLVDEPDVFELHFAAARKRKGAIIMGALGTAALVGGIPLLAVSGAVGFMMLLIGGFLVYGGIQQGTNDTVLRVEHGRVEVTHDGIGMPADVDFSATQVEEVLVHLGTNAESRNARYTISIVARAEEDLVHLQDQAGKAMDLMAKLGVGEDHPAMDAMREGAERPRILVADDFADKDEADWLAFKIEEAIRREADEAIGDTGEMGPAQ